MSNDKDLERVHQQLAFEDSHKSFEELTTYTCSRCGQQLLDECTASSCDEPECDYDVATCYELADGQELNFHED